ncbi:phage shock protein C (PspC) family protein [Sphaerotilus hippei]|uniref:Phage shock protein C (PspC) family protein n=1 Tax=Sphaerotilus hippei TaxID=744406 RepID=A0A318HCC3_9BURK|nr:PspC domain-containing protein [Sphaerotilus hippei]PXW98615.1 phage shock protein C (PspC) family protein [Sphaerotilus hippei]
MSLADDLLKLEQLRERGVLDPEEFELAKRRILEAPAAPPAAVGVVNRFRRSLDDRWVAGVCGGLARLTGAQAWIWRLCFALLFLFAGTGVLLYLLLWIFVPEEDTSSTPVPFSAR